MRLGFTLGTGPGTPGIDQYIADVKHAETLGFDQAWMAQVFSTDAITMMSIASRETQRIRLGTAVVPSFPRHPSALAIQALTANAAAQGRFDLGLGLSHKLVIEDMLGIPYHQPAKHMREYLEVLMPLVQGEACAFSGDLYRVHAQMNVPEAAPVEVLVAALGPRMLQVAGTLADGTTTYMTGPKTLENHIIPTIRAAAAAAGKPQPRVVAGFPIALCDLTTISEAKLERRFGMYTDIPSYRAMLDREGVQYAQDIAMLGDEANLRAQLQRLKDIGVDDFNAFCSPLGEGVIERTMAFLAAEKGSLFS